MIRLGSDEFDMVMVHGGLVNSVIVVAKPEAEPPTAKVLEGFWCWSIQSSFPIFPDIPTT